MEKEDSFGASNDDILGGIKSAISRGATLKEAMIALFNAGYSKGEIEDSARRYMMGKSEEIISTVPSKKEKKVEEKNDEQKIESENKKIQEDISRSPGEKPGVAKEEKIKKKIDDKKIVGRDVKGGALTKDFKSSNQKVSDYENQNKKKKKIEPLTIVLILLLALLLGVLVVVFLFKGQLVEFFNNLFG